MGRRRLPAEKRHEPRATHALTPAGLLLTWGLLACGGGGAPGLSTGGSTGGDGASQVLATIGDEEITMADVRARVGDDLDRARVEYEKTRQKTLETALQDILGERLFRAKMEQSGKTLDELLEEEAGGSLEPTDADISTWYAVNKARVGGRPLDQTRQQIAAYLLRQRREEVTEQLRRKLEQEQGVRMRLEPYRVTLDNQGAPSRGPDDAPVTLVEFSDFQCPFCRGQTQTLDRLTEDLGDTLRVVFRQFPLTNIHPNAERAAEASLCAQEQGRFWELHDLMFQEQDWLSANDLRDKADRLGLDRQAFDTCLASGRVIERIRADQVEGRRVGVGGTPALFVNGIPLDAGSQTYDVIARVIREEMERRER